MKIRPLYDRVVVKRVEAKRPPCEAASIFPIRRKKNPRRVK